MNVCHFSEIILDIFEQDCHDKHKFVKLELIDLYIKLFKFSNSFTAISYKRVLIFFKNIKKLPKKIFLNKPFFPAVLQRS